MVIIDNVKQPDAGAVVIVKCPHCKHIEISHSPYACKPKDGDLWLFNFPCLKCSRSHTFDSKEFMGKLRSPLMIEQGPRVPFFLWRDSLV